MPNKNPFMNGSRSLIELFFWTLAALMFCSSVHSAVYYVDSDGGSDTNDGLSSATAWKTITKLNATSFSPGDQILFQRGDTFSGQLVVPTNGTSANPISYGAYGSASDRPIVTGADELTTATYRWNLSASGTNEYYLTLSDGSNPSITSAPSHIWLDGANLSTGTLGSLTNNTWNYGNNDSLGFNTVYVRSNAGDPDTSGVTIERSFYLYPLYISTGQYVNFENIVFEKGDRIMRIITSANNMNFTNCVFRKSTNPVARLTDAQNMYFRNCNFETTYGAPLVYLGGTTGLTSAVFDYCVFSDSFNYAVDLASGTTADFTNCVFIGAQSGFLYNHSSIAVTAKNCSFTSPGRTNSSANAFINDGTGSIQTINCNILPNGNNPSNFNLSMVSQSNNIYKAPKYISHQNQGILSLVIDRTTNFTKAKAVADLAESYGHRIGIAVNSKTMTPSMWTDAQAYVARGHEIISLTRSHASLTSSNSFSVQYTGNASSATITFASPYLTTTLAGDQSDGSADLSIDTNQAAYDTLAEIAAYINTQSGYSSSVTSTRNNAVSTTSLQDVAGIDIKTAAHQMALDQNRLYYDEILGSKREIEANIPGFTCKIFAYPGTFYDATTMAYAASSGYLMGRTSVATEDTLQSYIRIYRTAGMDLATYLDESQIERDIHAITETANFNGQLRILVDASSMTMAQFAEIFDAIDTSGGITVMTPGEAADWIRTNGTDVFGTGTDWSVSSSYTADYRLQSDSPLINQGTSHSIASDYYSTLVPQGAAADIGIHEVTDGISPTSTPTVAATGTPEPTATFTPEPTATNTPEPTATNTPEPTATNTPEIVATATNTPEPAATNTPEPTATNTPEPTATNTPEPTATDTPEPTATNTPEPTATNTPEPTATNTPEPTATNTPEPTSTNTPEPTATNTPEPTATSTNTPEPTATNTPEPTATDTPEPTATNTPEPTATDTPEPTATNTPEPTATSTPEPTLTPTVTVTPAVATLRVSGPTEPLSTGDLISVYLLADIDTESLTDYDVKLTYDSSALELIEPALPGQDTGDFTGPEITHFGPGVIRVSGSLVNLSNAPSGDLELAEVIFQVLASTVDSATITPSESALLDDQGSLMDVTQISHTLDLTGPEPTATPTAEPTATNTPEPIATNTPEPTATNTPEIVATATNTPEPTATNTPEPTATDTPEPTATNTPEPTATDTPEPTATNTPEPTATNTPEPTATSTDTPEPTATDTPEPTLTNTPEPTATNTPEPTATDTPEPTATNTPEPTATDTPEPTATNTPEPTATDTPEPTATDTPEPTSTNTPEPTSTPTLTPTITNTPFINVTATFTHTPTGTLTATPTPTYTVTPTFTSTPTEEPTATSTPAVDEQEEPGETGGDPTPTPTVEDTPTATETMTPEPTATDTPEPTVTDTPEPTATNTPEPTATDTPEPTSTNTPEPTATLTPTPTITPTSTLTPTATATATPRPGNVAPTLGNFDITYDLLLNQRAQIYLWAVDELDGFPVRLTMAPQNGFLSVNRISSDVLAAAEVVLNTSRLGTYSFRVHATDGEKISQMVTITVNVLASLPTQTPTPLTVSTPTPTPTATPTPNGPPPVVWVTDSLDSEPDLSSSVDQDLERDRSLVVRWDFGRADLDPSIVTQVHVYVAIDESRIAYLGRVAGSDQTYLEWKPGSPSVVPAFRSGPEYGRMYRFLVFALNQSRSPFFYGPYTNRGPVEYQAPVWVTDNGQTWEDLSNVQDFDPIQDRSLCIRWNLADLGIDAGEISDIHVYVSRNGEGFRYLGRTGNGNAQLFDWNSSNRLLSRGFSEGPEYGNDYRFRIYALTKSHMPLFYGPAVNMGPVVYRDGIESTPTPVPNPEQPVEPSPTPTVTPVPEP